MTHIHGLSASRFANPVSNYPPITVEKVKKMLVAGKSLRVTAKAVGISPAMVSKIKAQMVDDPLAVITST